MSTDPYAARGVSADKAEVHAAVQHLDAGLFPNAFCRILPDLWGGQPDHVTCLHTDTAGTKPVLAYMYWRETGDTRVWKGLVQDALVMNLDDLACAGATQGFVASMNIARNKLRIPGEVVGHLIDASRQLAEAWAQLGIDVTLAGGETADVGDVVNTLDVGFTVGVRWPRNQVVANRLEPGLAIVALGSEGSTGYDPEYNSGIGCNGLTSARHDLLERSYAVRFPESFDHQLDPAVVYAGRHRLTDEFALGPHRLTLGQLVLSPTRTYLPVVRSWLHERRPDVLGLVHCTGGGQTKVLRFAQGLRVVKQHLFPVPLVFRLIQQALPTAWHSMFRTFNMGHRLEAYVRPDAVPDLLAMAQHWGVPAMQVGYTEALPANSTAKARLSLLHEGKWLEYEA